MFKAVVFDCDGMVVDNDRVSERVAQEFGAPMESIGKFFSGPFQQCVVGKADLKLELEKVKNDWRWQGTVDELLAYWFDPAHNRIQEGMKPIVDELRKKEVQAYVATNNEKYRTANLFEERGLGSWFADVFSSGLIGSKKPESEFFEYIEKHIALPKNKILFCDDDGENIAGARSYGFSTYQYTDIASFKSFLDGQ